MSNTYTRATRRAALAMDVPARRELASKHGASAQDVEDSAAWEAARDMGMSAGEYLRELAIDRAMWEAWDPEPRKAREAGDVYESRTPAQARASVASIRATLAGDMASTGRALLASYGHRVDVVIVSNIQTGTVELHRAVKTGTGAAAAKRADELAVKLAKSAKAVIAAEIAVKAAQAGKLASAVASAQARADVVARASAKLGAKFDLARAAHVAAACWDHVPECKPEITAKTDPEFFASHRAPKNVMPPKYRDVLRVHPDRGVSDPTGDMAVSGRAEYEAARDAREVALTARVIHDVVSCQPEYAAIERKARRAAQQRERRARARKAR